MTFWSATLVDGYVHIVKIPSPKPMPLCGVVLNRPESDDPRGVERERSERDQITCPRCLELS